MKVPHGNWFESPWQDIRSGIRQVTLDTNLEHLCCTVGRVENGNEINPHSHENEQIAIVLEGECDYYVDGSMYHMTPGSWIAIPPRSVHYTIRTERNIRSLTGSFASGFHKTKRNPLVMQETADNLRNF